MLPLNPSTSSAWHTPIAYCVPLKSAAGTVVHVAAGVAGQFGAVEMHSCGCAETPLAVALQICLELKFWPVPRVRVLVQSPKSTNSNGAPEQVAEGNHDTETGPEKLDHAAAAPFSTSALK